MTAQCWGIRTETRAEQNTVQAPSLENKYKCKSSDHYKAWTSTSF